MAAELNDYFNGCLYFTVNSLSRVLNRMSDDEFARMGLSSSQAFLLMLAIERPGISQKDASDELNLAQSTVSRFADALVRRGFLEKKSLGKGVELRATEAGTAEADNLQKAWHLLFEKYCEILGEQTALKLTEDTASAGRRLAEA